MPREVCRAIFDLMDIIKAKIDQTIQLLDELEIDLWLIFVRETALQVDPAFSLVVGLHATWQSLFAYSRTGEAVALVGAFDEADYIASGRFTEVRTYTADARQDIINILDRFKPRQIAINYSQSDPSADGITHGMYLQLMEYLSGTAYADRVISGESLMAKLRSRKQADEISRIRNAATLAHEAWERVVGIIRKGMTEIEMAALIDKELRATGGVPSFPTIVNAGDKTSPGHGHPTEARLEPGDLLHVDFGLRLDDYCSDIQRLLYFRRPQESSPPETLTEAFTVVRDIVTDAADHIRSGHEGWEIDARARTTLTDHGYPEYQHALGHQLGRSVHDGAAILGPKWERYGKLPMIKIETGNVFTLELEIVLPGIGCVGLEEDIVVTNQGGKFLCPRQLELTVI